MAHQSIRHRVLRAAIFAAALDVAMAGAANAADLAMTHAHIFASSDAVPIEDGTILIHDGRMAAVAGGGAVRVPRGAKQIDLHGGTVTAGFWNSPVHVRHRCRLHQCI